MKNLIMFTVLFVISQSANARGYAYEPHIYNPSSYGSPTLYYSHESIQERQELELLQRSNEINERRLNLELEQLNMEDAEHERTYEGEVYE